MRRIWLNCAFALILVSGCCGLPQGRGRAQEPKQVHQEAAAAPANLDPNVIEENMTEEHAKLIENLQRLKRTLDTVKERVGKGTYGEPANSNVDMKNPEAAILTVLKSLEQQGQLFAMINDMLKAGSEVQNHTAKIQEYSKLAEKARAESVIAENTNQLSAAPETGNADVAKTAAAPVSQATPSVGPADLTGPGPIASASIPSSTSRRGVNKQSSDSVDLSKQHGYDDYQYQYSDDNANASGDDNYDYHYDAQGYDAPRSSSRSRGTTTSTTTSRPPPRRARGRSRSDYY